jgi:hypothetical protein
MIQFGRTNSEKCHEGFDPVGRIRDRLDRRWRPYLLVSRARNIPSNWQHLFASNVFSGLVISWIATVFVMDGSLKNFTAEREQLEAERIGRDYMNRTNPQD